MADAKALFGSDSSDSEVEKKPARRLRISPAEDDVKSSSSDDENPPTPAIPDNASEKNSDSDAEEQPKSKERSPVRLLADESDEEDEQHVNEESVPKLHRSPESEAEHELEAEHTEEGVVEDEETETVVKDNTLVRVCPNLDGHFVYWKVQDYIRGETEPFDPEAYDDDFEDFEEDPAVEVQEAIRQKVLDKMRWRWNIADDGTREQESNTKLIKWSDGSTSIAIGNQYYDASVIALKGEYHQLFIRQGTGLQGGVVFKEKMTLRPALTSGTIPRKPRASAYATGDLAARQERRVVRIDNAKSLDGMKDPEKRRNELVKKEEERLKATIRRETQQRRVRERIMSRGITSSYLEGREEDEDENDISISAIKNSFKRGEYARHRAYSDEEESEGESRRKKLEGAKDLDDDDDDFGIKKKKTEEGSKKRVAVIEDDDDD